MPSVVRNDSALGAALSGCSPRIIKFLNGLTSERLKNLSPFMLADGTCLRVDAEPIRSFESQAKIYQTGRNCKVMLCPTGKSSILNPSMAWGLDLNSVKKVGTTYTNAFAGQSYHNYGLAVDLIWRIDGNGGNCSKERFIDTGIVAWAKQCGLGWGGDWAGQRGWGKNGDMAHFEDENYNIPLKFTETYKQAILKGTYSYNPNWVSGHDNFKWVCEYNGLSYAAELEKCLKEGGTSDGLKPSIPDDMQNKLKKTITGSLFPLFLGFFGCWFLLGRKK